MAKLDTTRFWVSPSVRIHIGSDGFLPDPTSKWGQHLAPGTCTSAEWDSLPTVLLGESGSGKSTTVRQHSSRSNAIVVSLREYASEDRLERDLTLRLRATSIGPAELILDGLEESPLQNPSVIFSVVNSVQRQLQLSISLRVCSRTGYWRSKFRDELAEQFQSDVRVLELLPLRRKDVSEILAQRNIAEEDFFRALRAKSLNSFAARPLTLNFLIGEFMERGELPSSRREVYRHGIDQLLGRRHDDDFTCRFQRISEIALTLRLCRMTGLSHSDTHDDEFIPISDVPSFGSSFNPPLSMLIDTGVFSARGENAVGFAHESYGDYLAGSALATAQFSAAQVLDLVTITVAGQRTVIPALEEVVGWATTLNPALAQQFLTLDPAPFLRTDTSHLSDSNQVCLVEALFARAASGRVDRVAGLPGLSGLRPEVILPVVRNRASPLSETEEQLQTEMFVALGLDAAPELRSIAFDDERRLQSRTIAAHALRELALSEDQPAFRRLALSPTPADTNDELKGIALRAVWPSGASLVEVLSSLTTPRRRFYYGAYAGFLERFRLPVHMTDDEWAAIETFLLLKSSPERFGPLSAIRKQIIVHLIANINSNTQLTTLLAKVIIQHLSCWNEELFDDVSPELFTDEMRLSVLDAILKLDPAIQTRQILAFRPALIAPTDVAECLARAESNTNEAMASRWCELAIGTSGHCDEILERRSSFPLLRSLTSWLEPIEIGSPLAERLQSQHKQRRARDMEYVWGSDNLTEILSHLDRCGSGDADAWWSLSMSLSRKHPTDHPAPAWSCSPSRFVGWAKLSADVQSRVLSAALDFLEKGTLDSTTWIDKANEYGIAACAALRAFTLLEDSKTHVQPSMAAWHRWACAVVALSRIADQPSERRIYSRAFELAPAGAAEGLRRTFAALERSESFGCLIDSLSDIKNKQKTTLLLTTLPRIQNGNVWVAVCSELLLDGQPAAFEALIHAINDTSSTTRSTFAARLLLEVAPTDPYPWELLQERPAEWGFAFLLSLEFGVDLELVFDAMSSRQLGSVASWLFRHAPPESDPKFDEAHVVGPREQLGRVRNQMLNRLSSRADSDAIAAILDLRQEVPSRDWLDHYASEARVAVAASTWVPPSPRELGELHQRGSSRFIQTRDDLVRFVLEELQVLQERIQATSLVYVFWNEGTPPSPKNEENLSDRIADWLRDRLQDRDVMVNREVQVRRSLPGQGGGRRLDVRIEVHDPVRRSETMLLIVEVKGIWNGGLKNDMAKQLVARYLAEPGASHGIYLIGWFAGSNYGIRAGFKDQNACREHFNNEAKALSGLCGKPVHAVVLDLSWPVD